LCEQSGGLIDWRRCPEHSEGSSWRAKNHDPSAGSELRFGEGCSQPILPKRESSLKSIAAG